MIASPHITLAMYTNTHGLMGDTGEGEKAGKKQ